jgi:hypothetical protein
MERFYNHPTGSLALAEKACRRAIVFNTILNILSESGVVVDEGGLAKSVRYNAEVLSFDSTEAEVVVHTSVDEFEEVCRNAPRYSDWISSDIKDRSFGSAGVEFPTDEWSCLIIRNVIPAVYHIFIPSKGDGVRCSEEVYLTLNKHSELSKH